MGYKQFPYHVQVKELRGSAEQLSREKIRLEADKEVEEESIVNRLQRQIEGLIQNYKVSCSAELKGQKISVDWILTDLVTLRTPNRHTTICSGAFLVL